MPKVPAHDQNVYYAPHVVLLGAGASIAAYMDWGRLGPAPPSMHDLIETLSLGPEIRAAGYNSDDLNFEELYDQIASNAANQELKSIIEQRVYGYFNQLKLPSTPTIYDYLILSLREKDIIATFNWDPFLLQAYMRNEDIGASRRPRIAFLHGNVMVAVCNNCKISGVRYRACGKCGRALTPSKLLYPIKHKDYNADPFIKGEWDCLSSYLDSAYMLTVFGYSAPVTDVEARSLMLNVWKNNETFELAEVDVIDIKPRSEIESTWTPFFHSHHYGTAKIIFDSYLFVHPRRSCDAFAAATLMCAPWHDNKFPKFATLIELQNWVRPLIEEEERYDGYRTPFSGEPLYPNYASGRRKSGQDDQR